MPLPWKKLRISQLVADLQSPAKRRGSMVVETGFPTSLVDLFVKNRDRLRKASKKHSHGHRRGIDSSDIPSLPNETSPNGGEDEFPAGGDPISCVDGFANRVSAAFLKTFVVVALALSTRKLVVGITLSAFALLLLECLGKHIDVDVDLGVLLKPCSGLLDLIQRGLPLFRLERLVSQESAMLCDSVDEIESVGDSSFEEEIRGREEGAGLGCVTVEREENCVDMRTARFCWMVRIGVGVVESLGNVFPRSCARELGLRKAVKGLVTSLLKIAQEAKTRMTMNLKFMSCLWKVWRVETSWEEEEKEIQGIKCSSSLCWSDLLVARFGLLHSHFCGA